MSFLILCAKGERFEGEGAFGESGKGTLSIQRQSCIRLLALLQYRGLSNLLQGNDFRRVKRSWPFLHLFGAFSSFVFFF